MYTKINPDFLKLFFVKQRTQIEITSCINMKRNHHLLTVTELYGLNKFGEAWRQVEIAES